MDRQSVIERIEKEKIVVIVRGVERKKLLPLAEALYEGGIRLIEVTYSMNGAVSDNDTAEMIGSLVNAFGEKMSVGAGTVLTREQVQLTKDMGGSFIISPDTCPEVIKRTRELDMVSIPGAITPTEAMAAVRAGADFVKLFPIAKMGGAPYVKAIAAPLSGVKFLAVGGIDEKNIPEYRKVGVKGFGVGANIVDKKLLDANDFQGITALTRKYMEVLQ
jgi:2-dehydro-3-deoxyphosphogluconate aldolase/(4S)-4-hydroxy-2-oxoglutarate aldolase